MRKISRPIQKKSTPAPAPAAAIETKAEVLTVATAAPQTATVEKVAAPVKSAKKPVAAKPAASAAPVETTAEVPVVAAETPAKAAVAAAPVEKAKVVKKAQAKPAAVKEVKPAKAVKEVKAKTPAPKKAKMVRDSFTIPETDYALFNTLKQRALAAGKEIKKGELLRAGLAVLNSLSENELFKVLASVERIKTGRPSK